MDFEPWHRIVFSVFCLGIAFFLLSVVFFGQHTPSWVLWTGGPPVALAWVLWMAIALPRHFDAVRHPRLRQLSWDPLLFISCVFPAMVPIAK